MGKLRLRVETFAALGVGVAAVILGAEACGGDGDGGTPGSVLEDGSPGDGPSTTDAAPVDAASSPRGDTWSTVGEAVSEGAVKSVARDATHLWISSTGVGAHAGSHLEKRRLVDGQLDATFGKDGYLALDPNSFITVGDGFVYVVSLDYKLRKLNKADGTQVWENTTKVGTSAARGIALDTTGIYVTSATFSSGFGGWIAQKHALDSGAVIVGFAASLPKVYGGTSPRTLTVGEAGLFIGGDIANSQSPPTNYAWHVERLDPSTGATKWSDEKDPSQYSDILRDLAVNMTTVYALVKEYSTPAKVVAYRTSGGAVSPFDGTGPLNEPYRVAVDATALYLAGLTGIDKRDAVTGAALGFGGAGGLATWGTRPTLASVDKLFVDDATMITVGTTRLDASDAGSPVVLFADRRSKTSGQP